MGEIVTLIKTMVNPADWRENGGIVGHLEEIDGKLIVTGTVGMHEKIRQLLESLRRK